MAVSGKRKKSKKPTTKARKVTKPKQAKKKSAASKKVKAPPAKTTKLPKRKESRRSASSRLKSKASAPTVEQIVPSGEPEFASNAPPVKL